MSINRHTCEAVFLDYYEGRLNAAQTSELFAFLEANPDLRERFDNYVDATFEDIKFFEDVHFPEKESLKKNTSETSGINTNNCVEYFIEAIEGNLNAADLAALEAFLIRHPEQRSEFELFKNTRLEADTQEIFEGKESLKKPVAFTVNDETFETVAVVALENELNADQLTIFNTYLAQHPEKKNEFALFESTKLEADESIVFENKDVLKKATAVIITPENFDEYAVALLDNELKGEELIAFTAYLKANPEQAQEIELLRQTILTPESELVFEDKASLKKSVGITVANFDEYAVASLEGQLNKEEASAFAAFLKAHPEKQHDVALFAQTRLQPELHVVYPDKAALQRDDRKAIVWWTVTRWSAAAAILLLLGIWGINYFNQDPTTIGKGIAGVDTINIKKTPAPQQIVVPQAPQLANNSNDVVPNKPVKSQRVPDGVKEPQQPIAPQQHTIDFVAYHVPSKAIRQLNSTNAQWMAIDPYIDILPTNDISNSTASNTSSNTFISPTQFLARKLKKRLDDKSTQGEDAVDEVIAAKTENQNQNVTGFDLASSAINRVGNGRLTLTKEDDKRVLAVGKYNITF